MADSGRDGLKESLRRYLEAGQSLSKLALPELEDLARELLRGGEQGRERLEDALEEIRARSKRGIDVLGDIVRAEVRRELETSAAKRREEAAEFIEKASALVAEYIGGAKLSRRTPQQARGDDGPAEFPRPRPVDPSDPHAALRVLRPGEVVSDRPAGSAAKKAPAKSGAKKSASNKAPAKKAPAKKAPAKKAAAKKASSSSAPAAKKAPAKKTPANKASAPQKAAAVTRPAAKKALGTAKVAAKKAPAIGATKRPALPSGSAAPAARPDAGGASR